MGQHIIVNVDRREMINAVKCGVGPRQNEQVGYAPNAGVGVAAVLYYLLCFGEARSEGEFPATPNKGRWFNNRIVVIGADVRQEDGVYPGLYFDCANDITEVVLEEFGRAVEVCYLGNPYSMRRESYTYDEMRAMSLPISPILQECELKPNQRFALFRHRRDRSLEAATRHEILMDIYSKQA